jgi:hypothetical protein
MSYDFTLHAKMWYHLFPKENYFPFFVDAQEAHTSLEIVPAHLLQYILPKREINVESRVRNAFPPRSKLRFPIGRVLQKLRFLKKIFNIHAPNFI